MRKILKCLSISVLLITLLGLVKINVREKKLVNAEEIYYTNLNNVTITKTEFYKLKQLGFIEKEIENLTNEQLELIKEMNIISMLDTDSNSRISTRSKEPNPDVSLYQYDRYYTLRGAYYEDYNGQEAYFVKVDLSYTFNPDQRMTDFLVITMENNIMPMPTSETTINIFGTLSYNELIYEESDDVNHYVELETINHYYSYTGENISKYNYYPDSCVAMKFDLPSDKINSSREIVNNDSTYTIDNKSKYFDIYMSMYCYFVPETTNVINTSFTGAHIHQYMWFNAEWSGITIIPQYPFIRSSLDISLANQVEIIHGSLFYFTNITYPNC